MSRFVRRQTNLDQAETKPYEHKYLLKKPRTHESAPVDNVVRLQRSTEEVQVDNPMVTKRRFELFIDLIWVGIIGNLAEHFSDQAYGLESEDSTGEAVFEFVILFLIAWRIWKFLQEFMSKYSTNDILERTFVVWALILAMGYGNNAVYVFDHEHPSNVALVLYIIFKASLLIIEAYYAYHLAHIRRRIMVQTILGLPLFALWIPAFWTRYPVRPILLLVAVGLEYWLAGIIDTPMAERFLKDDRQEILNTDHWIERIQDFYIIILGEGVLNLIRGSPLGEGLTKKLATGVAGLWIYYVLSGLFFNGDSSRKYIHAMKRAWWRRIIWLSLHISMFGATLILGVTVSFMINNPYLNSIKPEEHSETRGDDDETKQRLLIAMYSAKWLASSTLSIILVNQTVIALLNRSLDGPRTLKINNRYVRLLPRLFVVIVACCLPIDRQMNGAVYLGILNAVLIPCLLWEWTVSLERGGGFMEPI